MSSETKTAVTAHGEVEYETVECGYCGEDALIENVTSVWIGEHCGRWTDLSSTPDHDGVTGHGSDQFAAEYTLCSTCAESVFGYEGPSGVSMIEPVQNRPWVRRGLFVGIGAAIALLLTFIGVVPV